MIITILLHQLKIKLLFGRAFESSGMKKMRGDLQFHFKLSTPKKGPLNTKNFQQIPCYQVFYPL